jgi:nucleoside 2-deoxyribosyltransferase
VKVASISQLPLVAQPPSFCEYAAGECDQLFDSISRSEALFLYPNEPAIISATIEEAVQRLRMASASKRWLSWKDLATPGQIIFCVICKALRFTNFAVADVTTLNFNLLFEIGYAIGLGIPVVPLRDTSYIKDEKIFSELGLIDTLGYIDFENSTQLVDAILSRPRAGLVLPHTPAVNKERPLFIVKSPVQTEGMVRLMSGLKKSGLRFRSFDPRESARLSLHDAFKQAYSSMGVVVHLMAPCRRDALTHNSRCAFIAGMAMAANRQVLMLQETHVAQPIDYRDVIKSYTSPRAIPDLLIPFVRSVVEKLQEHRFVPTSLPLTPLEKIDLGDIAAENEILALRSYFVPTGQYNEAKRGHARLVIGRKGSGKTAIFYAIRSAYGRDRSQLVLDLKPEGHQFTKLREAILNELSPGFQQHVLTAFWNYLLLMEIAHKILSDEEPASYRDSYLREAYDGIKTSYGVHAASETE